MKLMSMNAIKQGEHVDRLRNSMIKDGEPDNDDTTTVAAAMLLCLMDYDNEMPGEEHEDWLEVEKEITLLTISYSLWTAYMDGSMEYDSDRDTFRLTEIGLARAEELINKLKDKD